MSAAAAVRLAEIAESIEYGVTASASNDPVGPKFLRITDIQNGGVAWENVPWCVCNEREVASARLKLGDIVFARTGATTGKSFLVRDCPANAVFASYLIRVRLGEMADNRFVSHFFQTSDYWAQITKSARGVAQPGVNATTLKDLKIPLPPLLEQRRIADILDKADALRAKRRAAIAKLDELTRSIFLDMFGDPATNPKGWEESSLSDLGAKFRYGTSVKSAAQGRPTLRIPNVVHGSIDLSDLKLVPLDDHEFERLRLQDDDILFVRTNGNPDFVGRCAVFETEELSKIAVPPGGFAYASYLIRARIPAERVNAVFLREYFSSAEGRRRIKSRSKTSAGQYNVNIEGLGSLAVPLPPATLQKDFAARVDAIARLRTAENDAIAGASGLFASLQHRAFRGEL